MRLALSQSEKESAPRLHLHNSVAALNNYQKNLGKELRSKLTQKKKAEQEEKNKVNKKFKKQFEIDKKTDERYIRKSVLTKEQDHEDCRLKDLTRIMLCFDEPEFKDKQISIGDIKEFTLLLNPKINEGLKFLVRFNIIKEINEKGNYFYSK